MLRSELNTLYYVGDGGALSRAIERVAFHELAVLEAILRTF
jgi:hypothetical protein